MVKRIAIEEARSRLSAVVDGVHDQPVLLTRRGRAVAAIVTIEEYELLAKTRRTGARAGPPTAHQTTTSEDAAHRPDAGELHRRSP